MALVYYTHWCPADGPALLADRRRVVTQSLETPATRERIVAEAADATALCYFVPDRIDDGLLAALPRLRVLAGFGKGYDNVDVASATRRGIWVTNVSRALTEATAARSEVGTGHLVGRRGIPAELLAHRDRTLFTAHQGTATAQDRAALARVQAENVLDVLEGRAPRDAVNQVS